MANKNLIKRAFSVTAALPGPSFADGLVAGHSVADGGVAPKEPNDRQAPGSNAATLPPIAGPSTPRTGPGSMLAFMAEQSEVHKEVVQLREQVAAFEGAEITRRLDPRTIRASTWANRDVTHFETEAFILLKEEIASAGGNVQPIKVRVAPDLGKATEPYEIVYGHRRHRACLELAIPVLAVVQTVMKDEDLFIEMERENRNRADLSAWEQGMMYLQALEKGLFPSAKQLAAAIDRDTGNIGRAMALAKLPAEVVTAFGSPLNLQFRWATPLKDAHQRDPEGLLSAARALAISQPRLSPAEVFAALTQVNNSHGHSVSSRAVWKDGSGSTLAAMERNGRGKTTLSFSQRLSEVQSRRLKKAIDDLLDVKAEESPEI
jgi:ParB family chromosome partitioning protein